MSQDKGSHDFDLVFLGGGLSSGLMSRYLKKRHPELKILVLEKNETTHWNPGESTVGVAGFFMIRDLGLSTYCYLNHLPKNGLRYFFTNSHSEFDPTRCSEIGSNILPIFPTFQVDRARLDKDLWELNARIGIETKTGAQVRSVAINPTEKMHSVEYCQDGMMHPVKARWIINSSGRTCAAAPYFDKLSPASPDPDHHTAGAWGR
ncbi:NAD(P)/FAD-dependent oxidoreductase, partial [bacterium]|nr:NAD(P)/FAD-dependent oxidoreductase [bacterium]